MIARTNHLALVAFLGLILGFAAFTLNGCTDLAADDDDSASDDDDSAGDDDDSAEEAMWTALALAIIVYYMLELKRQLRETREHVETLHNDVREEIYQRYGERFDGKK